MIQTKTMLLAIASFMITYALVGFIGYLLFDMVSYRLTLIDPGMVVFMSIFGWLPAAVIAVDYHEKYS